MPEKYAKPLTVIPTSGLKFKGNGEMVEFKDKYQGTEIEVKKYKDMCQLSLYHESQQPGSVFSILNKFELYSLITELQKIALELK